MCTMLILRDRRGAVYGALRFLFYEQAALDESRPYSECR